MKRWRYLLALAATLLAAALPAHAFVLSGPAEVAVDTKFNVTLSGTLDSVQQLSVLIDYPSALVGMRAPCDINNASVSFMDPGVTGQGGALEGLQPDLHYPCLYTANVTTDPFSVLNGAILNVGFQSLNKTGSATITFYTSVLDRCGDVQQSSDWSSAETTVRIVANPGNNIPEPATVWLAFAALIAGGLIFRKDSKRS